MELLLNMAFWILGIGGVLTPLVDYAVYGRWKKQVTGYIALACLLSSALLLGWFTLSGTPTSAPISDLISVDPFSIFFALVFLLVGILVTMASIAFMHGRPNQGTYFGMIQFAVLGSMLVGLSVDLIMLYVAWDLMFVATLVLAGIRKKDPLSSEAALKYYVLGALSTALVSVAIAYFIGIAGTTSLAGISVALSTFPTASQPFLLLAIVFAIAGFGIKMAVVPFHFWIPDTYEGAPTPIGGLLAAGTKKAGFAAGFRVLTLALVSAPTIILARWSFSIAILAAVTMTVGNIAALTQKSFPRMIAYSSIAQAGYILIGLAFPTYYGLTGALFHIFNHAIMTVAAFIAAAGVLLTLESTSIASYDGLAKRMPVTAFVLMLTLLALGGIPPLNGFWSKAVLFLAAVEGGALWLALVMALNSAFSLGYYAWIVKRMYFDDSDSVGHRQERRGILVALGIAALLIIVVGLYPSPFFAWASQATLRGP